ncbi:MAG: universal stress protein [Methyloceanibacter sp.]|nr:universal stress protein [Methyloceanibacter sp.]
MSQNCIAYMPLATDPEAPADESILATTEFAATLDWALHVTTFAVDIPEVSSPLGSVVVDFRGLVRAAEEKSEAECLRLQTLVKEAAGSRLKVDFASRKVPMGTAADRAAVEARYFDLVVVPWSSENFGAQNMAQAIVFGSGRPTILVPPEARAGTLDHIAVAWDESRVAARALGDALPLLAKGGRVSVLTVQGDKPLTGPHPADALASSLEKRGVSASPIEVTLGKKSISEALQDTALSEHAQLLAMGGFGHSRIRDFVLGGATNGVLAQLKLPTLISH